MNLLTDTFFSDLEQLYKKDENLSEYWKHEESELKQLLPLVAERIAFNYKIEKPIGVGGSGIVAIVHDINLGLKRALKIARPSPGKKKLLARLLEAEAASLLRLSHRNLIQIFAKGAITIDNEDYPFYVMEFVEGAKDADVYLRQPGKKQSDLIHILDGVLSAIAYLHDKGTIHMDIKPGNILVTPNGDPVVSDLGFAKQLRVEDKYTLIGGTDGYIHPGAYAFVNDQKTDPNRLRGEAPVPELKREWDFYPLGKTFLNFIKCFDEVHHKEWTPYVRRYLKLMSCRLLDGYNTDVEVAIGLSKLTLNEIKYTEVRQAKTDLDKLTGSYNLEARIPEFNPFIQDTIQASTIATTPFTKRVSVLLSHPAFMRLGKCTQLGLLNLIYPTACHTRAEHSLGTFSLLAKFILALYNDALNPLFKQIMTEDDLRAVLLAGLLHDIGQYALAHDLEEADEDFFSHVDAGSAILKTNSTLRLLIEAPQPEGWDVPTDRIIAILSADSATMTGTLKDRILHSLIDGPVDADKIDYLIRDSRNLGLKYGSIIDIDHFLRCLTIIYRNQENRTYAVLGIHEKGKVTAEAIGFARYAMFGQVYWHHAYRAIKSMIHRMVWEMGSEANGNRSRIKSEFRSFIFPEESLPVQQLEFSVSSGTPRKAHMDVSQADETDLAVLNWLSDRSGCVGLELFELLSKRRLFKRILVLSKLGGTDGALWENISEFYRRHKKNWRAKLELQRAFQRRVSEFIENPKNQKPLSQIITINAKSAFLADARTPNKPVFLIDIPPERKPSNVGLEYLVEEDRRRFKSEEVRTEKLEQSIVWKTLQRSFHESIAKLRIFCHPDHADFVASSFVDHRSELENILSHSLTEVEQKFK
jgi:HD superfamily phosphohydrolase